MPDQESMWLRRPAAGRGRSVPLLLLLVCLPALPACKRHTEIAAATPNPLARQLAGARLDAAKIALEKNLRDEALLLLVSSLQADPDCREALLALRVLLAETRWQFPALQLDAGLPVEKMTVAGSSLWTSVSGGLESGTHNSTVRWNLENATVEAVLFPRPAEKTQALLLSPDHEKVVIQRGTPGDFISLLCNSGTLQPIRNLGAYPENCSVADVTTFSPDGLLIAYPQANTGTLTWQILDAATGEIIRSQEQPKTLIPLSAALDRENLNVFHADGTQLKIPVSPVGEVASAPAASLPLEPLPPFSVNGHVVTFPGTPAAPVRSQGTVTAFAIDGDRSFSAAGKGRITAHRILPAVKTTGRDARPIHFEASTLATLASFAEGLSGLKFDEVRRTFTLLSEPERRAAIERAGTPVLPGLDFSPLRETILGHPCRIAGPDAAFLLHDRIVRATESRPRYLAIGPESTSPQSSVDGIEAVFRSGDSAAVIAAVKAIPAKDPAAAAALSLAFGSEHPEWLGACLETATLLPPLLKKLALSRIAWLEEDKAAAISLWRDGFPDMELIRRSEDWDGWETIDFTPLFAKLFTLIDQELATFELAPGASPEQRKALAGRLLDPQTALPIGRPRHAEACLHAARELLDDPETGGLALELAIRARELGSPPVPCLRTEAMAYTKLQLFPKAHETWISLITHQPVETHEPGDYAEAAYTAFETGNGDQAMEILNAGVHRFPDDADFAYRAGWISLLTARWDRAHTYLLAGERSGFSAEKQEKATAMLAIAASESGYSEDAADYFSQLIRIDPAWASEDPPQTDGWPPELKTSLQTLAHPPKAVPVMEDGSSLLSDPLAPLDPVPMVEDTLPLPGVPQIEPNTAPVLKSADLPDLSLPK